MKNVKAMGAKSAALEIKGKSVDKAGKQIARLSTYGLKFTSSKILKEHDKKLALRVLGCRVNAWGGEVELYRKEHETGEVRGGFCGLVTCRSVWACPSCSAKISAVRKSELDQLLSYARGKGHAVVMLTLTCRHQRATELKGLLTDQKAAMKSLRQSRGWRSLPLVGSVSATEVTHGRNGFHPHAHVILVFDASESEALAAVEALRSEWSRSLAKVGRDGNAAAFHVQNASATGDYLAKFAAASELALSRSKSARSTDSRSVWEILSDASDGCGKSAALWAEYVLAFKGTRQLVWSRGLKALAGVEEISDEEAVEVETVSLRKWSGLSPQWRKARLRVCSLLDAAENGTDLDAAEYGEKDVSRYRRAKEENEVIEYEGKTA